MGGVEIVESADAEGRMTAGKSLLGVKAVVRSGLRRCSMSSNTRRASFQNGPVISRALSRSEKGS